MAHLNKLLFRKGLLGSM